MTLGDVRGVLNTCPHPVRIKTVPPGSTFCKDLKLYLSKCFTPGSVDSQLQQVIRENLYLRAVPCTTRQPRVGEISGIDYNFVSVEEFFPWRSSEPCWRVASLKGTTMGRRDPSTSAQTARPLPTRSTATCSETSALAANPSATWRRLATRTTVKRTPVCQAWAVLPLLFWVQHFGE
uniref:Guanylate kinase-like domain-containing protein n=1 Tax=Neogobius melanostomus TaxID=47308 RepID=A0A8C6SRP2_9GOBI